jgi:hypoxanthine phosphoribosyltransferase
MNEILKKSSILFKNDQIMSAISTIAKSCNAHFNEVEKKVTVLPVMKGAIPFAGHLITKLNFDVILEYIHATRYQQNKGTENLQYIYEPPVETIINKDILLLDDILDEGITLLNLKNKLIDLGANSVLTAVLFDKNLQKNKPLEADFVGLEVPNKYVFGFGLDFKGRGRNLPHLYAYNEK